MTCSKGCRLYNSGRFAVQDVQIYILSSTTWQLQFNPTEGVWEFACGGPSDLESTLVPHLSSTLVHWACWAKPRPQTHGPWLS